MLIKSKTNDANLILKKPHLSIKDTDMILLRRKTDEKVFKLTHFASLKNNKFKNNEKNEKKESFKKINFIIDNGNEKEKNIEKNKEKDFGKNKEKDKDKNKEDKKKRKRK